jgi:dephospho-CoA kinase
MTLVVGLTGGIASGKSTVARLLVDRGARVVDADRVAREVVALGTPALAEIRAAFGDEVLQPDGRLDRARLAERVFGDIAARRLLEAITHPRIAERFVAERLRAEQDGVPLLVYEAALLVESGAHHAVDRLVVVAADPTVQIARIVTRDGVDEAAARARIDAQAPVADKVAQADHVLWNQGSPAELEHQVDALWEELTHGEASEDPRGGPAA